MSVGRDECGTVVVDGGVADAVDGRSESQYFRCFFHLSTVSKDAGGFLCTFFILGMTRSERLMKCFLELRKFDPGRCGGWLE